MRFIIKLAALAVVLALLAPIFSANSSIGQFVSAAMRDVTTFCDRQPEACYQGVAVVRETGQFFARAVSALRTAAASPEGAPLTEEDRQIFPHFSTHSPQYGPDEEDDRPSP
ncbi:MAG: hypothetical protein ROR55_09395 [Devosia sp.]